MDQLNSKLLSLLLVCALLPVATPRAVRKDPETGRIRILYLGDTWGTTPFHKIRVDPSFVPSPVPASYSHNLGLSDAKIRRMMRLYLPRTYDGLISDYDLVLMSDTNMVFYGVRDLTWIEDGVRDAGMGLMMVGGAESFGSEGYTPWGSSPIEEALPTICLDNKVTKHLFEVKPSDPDHPFSTSLDWSQMPPFSGMNLIKEKAGSDVVLVTGDSKATPVLVYWDYGTGSSVAHLPDLTPAWGGLVMQWKYYADYVANLLFLATGAEIPQDQFLLHDIRQGFEDYHSKRSLTMSVMEFASRFGAQIQPAEEALQEITSRYREAEDSYLSQEYEATADMLEEIDGDLKALEKTVLKMKDKALLWIYVIEWMVVSGTLILCGSILWALMIRRRLYREVRTTRLSEAKTDGG